MQNDVFENVVEWGKPYLITELLAIMKGCGLNVHRSTLQKACQDGRIIATKFGRTRWLITGSEAIKWVNNTDQEGEGQ